LPKIEVEKHRYQTLAMMVVENWPVEDICKTMDLEERTAVRFASGKGPEGFNLVLKAYREKINTQVVQRKFRFAEMAEKAYHRIETSLNSQNEQLATDTAWKVLQQVSPEMKDPGISMNVNMTSNHTVNQQMVKMSGDMLGMMALLKKNPGPDFTKHLKHGTEALPPAVQDAMNDEDEDTKPFSLRREPEIVEVGEGEPAPQDPEDS
jgi:hypothetical protein